MRDGEEDLQQPSVADLARVEDHLHRFGVPGRSLRDDLVVGGVLPPPGIAGHGARTPFTCWKTPWTPQKQPPAKTATSDLDWPAGSSTEGGGMTRAFSPWADGIAIAASETSPARTRTP